MVLPKASRNAPDRRQMLGLLAAGAVMAPAMAQATSAPGSLGALARAKGLRFGTAVGMATFGDPRIRELIVRECDIIVPENELKMYVTHNNNATDYNFAPADQMLAWAETNTIAMRGHNFVWARDEFTPKWLKAYDFGSNPKLEAERLLRAYIGKVADHYGERLASWDVVNETVSPETGHIRSSVFTRILGPDALRIAYEEARAHLPKTQLVYNDYMSWESGNETHQGGVLNILKWMRDHKVPVDALGVQSHLGTGFDPSAGKIDTWQAFLDDAVAMDFDLLITEFDVNDQRVQGSITERDKASAQVAKTYLDLMLSYKQLKDVLVWGIQDKYSWLQSFTPRVDKLPVRATPFDENYQPKPLYDAIAAAFKAAPAR